ncbi:MAG: HU domain-containing protein [archaeon]|nr:HU domain-containing protein [archaeon]
MSKFFYNKSNVSSDLMNSINSRGFSLGNKGMTLNREVMITNYKTETINQVWNVLCQQIQKNYCLGKGTLIKPFGTFTFDNYEVDLSGTTNEYQRDKKLRSPVFIVSSEFSDYVRPGQYNKTGGIIYYRQKLNNTVNHVKVNYAEIGYAINLSRDECENIIKYLLRHISDSIIDGSFKNKEMPGVGTLILNQNVLGVKFNEDLIKMSRSITQKLNNTKRNMNLSMDYSKSQGVSANELNDAFKEKEAIRPKVSVLTKIDKDADNVIKEKYGIDISSIPSQEENDIYRSVSLSQSNNFRRPLGFINDKKIKKKSIKAMKLVDLNLSKDILESFEFFKGKLVSAMKSYDKLKNGIIQAKDCEDAIIKCNINMKLDPSMIRDLVSIYSKGFDSLDYMNFIASLIKDSRKIIFDNFINGTNGRSDILKRTHSQKSNQNNLMNNTSTNWGKYNQSFKQDNSNTLLKSSNKSFNTNIPQINQFSKTSKNFHTNVNLLTTNKKIIDDIGKVLDSIKSLLPDMKMKMRIRLDQNISVDELINILAGYSVVYAKEKIIKTLNFLEIPDIMAFNIYDLENAINNNIILQDTKIPSEDIFKIFNNIKDVIFVNGGKSFLFPEGVDSVSSEDFINLLSQKTKYTNTELTAVFNYLVKTNRNFNKDDYKRYFEETRKNFNNEFELSSMKAIGEVIERKHLKTDEYFDHLLSYNKSTKNKLITRQDFIKILQREKIGFSAEEIDHLFTYIDFKKDGVIDREEFVTRVCYVSKPLSVFQDIIKKNNLDIEDLCHRMGITTSTDRNLTYSEFADTLKKFDYTFSNQFISSIFNELKNRDDNTINTQRIIEEFNVFKKDFIRTNGETPYIESFKNHYMEAMRSKINFINLKAKLEEMDQNFSGKLPRLDYSKVIEKILPEFTDTEHMKFIRITNKFDKNNYVMYPEMLDMVYYHEGEDNFTHLCKLLSDEINTNCNGNIERFYIKILSSEKIRPVTSEELKRFINNTLGDNTIYTKTICKLDLDSDGLISKEDMRGVLGRYISSSFFKYENNENEAKTNLYSSETMKEEKFKTIVKKLKQYMKLKNINEVALFKKLDKNNDGFISSIDFNTSIDAIIKIAPAIKDQFFNFLDFYHNGLVDLDTFLYRFKDFTSAMTIAQNNHHIEKIIIKEFEDFLIKNKNLSDTEVFSLLDKDCDGLINLDDFKYFVIKHLSISKDEFNDYKLERVMQALSLSKNKNIGLNDIKEFMNKVKNDSKGLNHMNLKEIFKETNSQNLAPNKDNMKWIHESIERFGMFISEKYNSISDYFEENTEKGTNKFKFEDFIRFHERNYECFNNGFNLTKDELLAIFTSLDSQKKNYLTLQDLENKLNLFDYYKKMHIDVKSFLKQNFYNGFDAFKFFIRNTERKDNSNGPNSISQIDQSKTSISKKEFFEGFQYFFPKKYSTDTILKYMTKYFSNPNLISFSEFNYIYFDKINSENSFIEKRGEETKLLTSREEMNKTSSFFRPKDKVLQTPFDSDPLNKLKRIIQSSRFDLEMMFKAAQEESVNGIINKFQLRKFIKSIGVGLTNLEIDQIMKRVGMTFDGKINLTDFIKFVKAQDNLTKISIQNISSIIGEIKQLIYKYYSNPIACFQMNDKSNTLKLDFERFKQIIIDMYTRDLRQPPNFTLMKSAYDALDLRKDGIIDLNEWIRALGSFNGSLDVGANGVNIGFSFFDKKNKTSNNFYKANRKILREWETSGDVCSIYKVIAKNKKLIKESLKTVAFNDGGNLYVQTDNLVRVLQDIMPLQRLSNTQWKMICYIGKFGVENMIDLNMFFSMVDMSVKNLRSHPKAH